jgi:DNA-binding NtrC family response regulator
MIGESPAFKQTLRVVEKIARYHVPVLIEGETGTGKELAARAIHYESPRRDQPFVPVNCGAIPDSLVENELFGHDRGAFTDARDPRRGLVAFARRGTLFLDEVDMLSPRAQVTLLRFVQDQHYRPLGSNRQEEADVRIIAATNANLEALAAGGSFRSDLFYRLRILHLTMPPLRERRGDPALLSGHFLEKLSARFDQPVKPLHASTLAWFDRYAWPGNIRELENLICRNFLLADAGTIEIEPPDSAAPPVDEPADPLALEFAEAKAVVLRRFERQYLVSLLTRTHGNVTLAASLAGKERRAFGKMLKKHQIDRRQLSVSA